MKKRQDAYKRNEEKAIRREKWLRKPKGKKTYAMNPLKYDPNAAPGVFPKNYFNYPDY